MSMFLSCSHQQHFAVLISVSSIPIKWEKKILPLKDLSGLVCLVFRPWICSECIHHTQFSCIIFPKASIPPYFSSTFISVTLKLSITVEENQSKGHCRLLCNPKQPMHMLTKWKHQIQFLKTKISRAKSPELLICLKLGLCLGLLLNLLLIENEECLGFD